MKKKATKKPAPKKKPAKKPAPKIVEHDFKKGLARGSVTEMEIMHVFSEVEEYLPVYEEFLNRLDKGGINIIEMKEGLLGKSAEREGAMASIRIVNKDKDLKRDAKKSPLYM